MNVRLTVPRAGRVNSRHAVRRETGLTLVELMISLVVGLILIAAVFNMYTGNVRSARFTEGLQSIQENGRYAVSVLQRELRLAGYSPLNGPNGQIDAFDIASSNATTLVIQTRQAFDCNGLDTNATDGLAINTYTLDTTKNELTCTGNQAGSAPMAVVEDVEQFQILFGIDDDSDTSTCEPQRYVPFEKSLESSEVVALRFALLINSGNPIRTRNVSKTYVLLDKEVTSGSDRLVREVFGGTVLLRNNTSCTNV